MTKLPSSPLRCRRTTKKQNSKNIKRPHPWQACRQLDLTASVSSKAIRFDARSASSSSISAIPKDTYLNRNDAIAP